MNNEKLPIHIHKENIKHYIPLKNENPTNAEDVFVPLSDVKIEKDDCEIPDEKNFWEDCSNRLSKLNTQVREFDRIKKKHAKKFKELKKKYPDFTNLMMHMLFDDKDKKDNKET